MPTAYGYCRVSVADDASVSLEAQEAALRRYHAHRFDAGVPLVILADEDVSGAVALLERPAGSRLATMQAGDHLLLVKLDRGFRSVADGAVVLEQLTARRIALHSLDVQVDTSTIAGRMMLQLLLVFAEMERARIGERRREAAAHRRQRGDCMHTELQPPVGWRVVGRGPHRRYTIDHDYRRWARRLLQAHQSGVGYHALAERAQRRRPKYAHSRSSIRRAIWAARNGFPLHSRYVQNGPMAGRYRTKIRRGRRAQDNPPTED